MRDITLCHPRLQVLCSELQFRCKEAGLKIGISETLRTVEEQESLYAQGRTAPGNIVTHARGTSYSSYHQWGTAFDFYRNDGAGAYNDSDRFFSKVGTIGKLVGLEWGGDWKSPVDKPHFQLPDWGSSTSGIKKVYSNPEEFIKTWDLGKSVELKSGWYEEDGGWRFYNGDTGICIRNDWYHDTEKDLWYWFDGSGLMVRNTWYRYNGKWFYLNNDGVMCKSQLVADNGKIYAVNKDGEMITKQLTLTPDDDGALTLTGLANK